EVGSSGALETRGDLSKTRDHDADQQRRDDPGPGRRGAELAGDDGREPVDGAPDNSIDDQSCETPASDAPEQLGLRTGRHCEDLTEFRLSQSSARLVSARTPTGSAASSAKKLG